LLLLCCIWPTRYLMPSSPPVTMATGSDVSTTAFCCQDVLHSWWVARRVRSIPYNENGPFRRFRVNSHWHYKKILKLTFLEINKTNARPIAGAWHFVKETGGEILIGHFKPNDLHGLGSQAFPPPIYKRQVDGCTCVNMVWITTFLTRRLCKQSKGLCCGADYANDALPSSVNFLE